ncbi:MAG: trypsin-like peptidase domain-containing protein [Clostridia bacterium]|nr:trypsin-like peptidase domain-containing protein [Clostridia bacterium]
MKRLKKLLAVFIAIISIFIYSSCITVTQNNSGDDINAVNGLTTQGVIRATFAVYSQQYNQSLIPGVEPTKQTSLGSGVIYEAENVGTSDNPEYSYKLLTNNHVIYQDVTKFNTVDYFVKDCYGERINATVISADPNYDLAVVTFKSETLYPDLDFTSANITVGTKLISVGYPHKQINAVTLGKAIEYSGVNVTASAKESNIKFKALKHSAPIYSGSSGGAVLTYDYKICAINFGAVEGDNNEFEMACAVPVQKVKEYLSLNNLISTEKLGEVA